MKTRITLVILVLAGTIELATPADLVLPKLPDLYVFRYVPQGRDPFISAEAKQTLVSGETDPGASFTTKTAQQYLNTIIQAIKKELFVEGVSTDENGREDQTIEQHLSKLEDDFERLRREKIMRCETLTDEDKAMLCAFVACAHFRTRRSREHWKRQLGRAVELGDRIKGSCGIAVLRRKGCIGKPQYACFWANF
jgi:hypothetical protein